MVRGALLISFLLLAFVAGNIAALWPSWQQQVLLNQQGVQLFSRALPVQNGAFITHDNASITLEALRGKNSLIFFGYTLCPDICPDTLINLNRVWKQLPDEVLDQWQVVLVSVDPERDTPAALEPYMNYFNPEFIALTGNEASLKQIAADLNAVYNRVDRGENKAYLMDHSANITVLDKNGLYQGYIAPPHNAKRMVPLIETLTLILN